MKTLTLIFIFSISCAFAFCQDSPIIIKRNVLGGNVYWQQDKRLSFADLYNKISEDEKALTEFKIAKRMRAIDYAIGIPAAIVTGLYIEGYLKGRKENAVPFVVGGTLLLLTVPIEISWKKHLFKAVQLYNHRTK